MIEVLINILIGFVFLLGLTITVFIMALLGPAFIVLVIGIFSCWLFGNLIRHAVWPEYQDYRERKKDEAKRIPR